MPGKFLISQIDVESPCSASWDAMTGNDQVRFCDHCNLSVNNLSGMTRNQVFKLIAKSDQRLCVRFIRRPDGHLLLNSPRGELGEKLHQIGRRVSRVAAGAFTATLSVTGAVAQQTPCAPGSNCDTASLTTRWALGGTIHGIVTDSNGAAVAGASVSLFNGEKTLALYTTSDDAGEYRFEGLNGGSFNLRIDARGFSAKEEVYVYVQPNGDSRADQTLEADSLPSEEVSETYQVITHRSMGGAVAIVAPSDPFIRAAQADDLQLVTQMLAGRNVNLRDKTSHTTALEHAARNANREMVQLLLAAGADAKAANESGETVLMMLDSDATSDLVWDLVNAAAKVNAKDVVGNTPLMEAASVNNVDLLKTLLEAGAQVNAKNKKGQTALMMAASEGAVNNVRALILAGANLAMRDLEGKNALFYATDGDHTAAARLLRVQGAEEVAVVKKEDN